MTVARVSDAQVAILFRERAVSLQGSLADLQDQIASGRRLRSPVEDPLAAGQVERITADLGALAQYRTSSTFGADVLAAQDDELGDANTILTRAEELATQQANGLLSANERAAAAEEVHGMLEALTAAGNKEFAGRRVFGGLALDAPPPFADPNAPGYDPTTAYGGSTQEFMLKVGAAATERVRISTRGDAVFTPALTALRDLETALATNGNVAGTLSTLGGARASVAAERASVGARQNQLRGLEERVKGLALQQEKVRSELRDADLTAVVSQLTQAQTALQALLLSGAQIQRTSLVDVLRS